MIGQRLAHFENTAKIGDGGMGEVYQARDTKLGREVAIKVLPEAFVSDPDRLARFTREARVLASLNHPNIGGIHEGGKGQISPASGRKWQISTSGGVYSAWTRQGRELVFQGFDGGLMSAQVDGTGPTFEVDPVTRLFEGESPTGAGYRHDVTAAGERFLVLAGAESG